eukprot:1160247-Pelagomonas_calceolata.AAC.20
MQAWTGGRRKRLQAAGKKRVVHFHSNARQPPAHAIAAANTKKQVVRFQTPHTEHERKAQEGASSSLDVLLLGGGASHLDHGGAEKGLAGVKRKKCTSAAHKFYAAAKGLKPFPT